MLARWKCARIEALMWAYTERRLKPSDAARVERHLQRCPACRARLDEAQQTARLVAAYRASALPRSQTTWQDLQLRLEPHPVQSRTGPILRYGPYLAWTAAVVTVLALGMALTRRHPAGLENVADNGFDHRLFPPKQPSHPIYPKKQPNGPVKRNHLKFQKHFYPNIRIVRADAPFHYHLLRHHHYWAWHLHHRRHLFTPERDLQMDELQLSIHDQLAQKTQKAEPAKNTLVAYSVDGDRPALAQIVCDFVMPAVGAPDVAAPAKHYVIDNVAASSEPTQTVASTADDKEPNIW